MQIELCIIKILYFILTAAAEFVAKMCFFFNSCFSVVQRETTLS